MGTLKLNSTGKLDKGIHKCTGDEFIKAFCESDYRRKFKKALTDIFDYAVETNAKYLFIGGSFNTDETDPKDIDCLLVYDELSHIPRGSDRLIIGGIYLDIMFASMDNKEIVDSYIHLFTHSRFGQEVGIVQVELNKENDEWEIVQPGVERFEIIKAAYINREIIRLKEPTGILVTIHGLLSTGEWNKEIAPIASSQGWIIAPYIYKENTPNLLVNGNKRKEIVDDFRDWIFELQHRFDGKISVIAHSFGTYIIGAYLQGFETAPIKFNNIILTGSILNSDYDWERLRGKSVGKVLNEVAPEDVWVKLMPEKLKGLLKIDSLMGRSGTEGFKQKSTVIAQSTNSIFTHNNVIKRDVISYKWMPFLEANKNSLWEEQYNAIMKEFIPNLVEKYGKGNSN
ncbi:hypothetical protein FB545_0710 [Peribacillus frigoritolerans]|uniref:DUF6932 family protein n=1 Tax=Peribacillus frigoritolerans TaxID=450367 RepID=UPI00119B0E69|nr:hypothetical protein [Peribacillus frigoritolerans]TWE03635.1 hypothetical protein FB545_0710 [Peribacillus frigoritolerans]